MAIVQGVEKVYSIASSGQFGRAREFGCSMNGQVVFGDEPIKVLIGHDREIELTGIYQKRHKKGRTIFARLKYYFPKNPRTEAQQENRDVLRQAVVAWQGLTSEQKLVYNNRARGKARSGYNIFTKEYILSH